MIKRTLFYPSQAVGRRSLSLFTLKVSWSLIICAIAYAQPPGIEWEKVYQWPHIDHCNDIINASSGGYVVAGSVANEQELSQAYIAKLDFDGDTLWNRFLREEGADVAEAVIQLATGGYAFAGIDYGPSGGISAGILDSTGSSVWIETYEEYSEWIGQDICEASDRGLIVIGSALSLNTIIFKIDLDGDVVWHRRFIGAAEQQLISIRPAIDGGYLVVGNLAPPGGFDYDESFLIKVSATGDSLWTRSFTDPDGIRLYDLNVESDGSITLAGNRAHDYDQDAVVIRTNESGVEQARYVYTAPGTSEIIRSIEPVSGGGYILSGIIQRPHEANDAYLIRIENNFEESWTVSDGNEYHNYSSRAIQSTDGGSTFAGGTYTENVADSYGIRVVHLAPEMSTRPVPKGVPSGLYLVQNYPNPFNSETTIEFGIPYTSSAEIAIYNILGHKLQAIMQGLFQAGKYTFKFEAANLSSGKYFIQLTFDDSRLAKGAVLVK